MYQRILYTFYVFSYVLGGLFIYTGTKKLKDYTSYAAHIEASQLFTTTVSPWVSKGVIAIEILLALLLITPITRIQIWAWCTAFLLMVSYSYYIYYILKKAPFVPCACKAVYEQLGWMGHLYLNAGIAILALMVFWMYYKWISIKN